MQRRGATEPKEEGGARACRGAYDKHCGNQTPQYHSMHGRCDQIRDMQEMCACLFFPPPFMCVHLTNRIEGTTLFLRTTKG